MHTASPYLFLNFIHSSALLFRHPALSPNHHTDAAHSFLPKPVSHLNGSEQVTTLSLIQIKSMMETRTHSRHF